MHGVRYCDSGGAQQYHSSKLISICYVVRTSVLCTFQIKYRLISFCITYSSYMDSTHYQSRILKIRDLAVSELFCCSTAIVYV